MLRLSRDYPLDSFENFVDLYAIAEEYNLQKELNNTDGVQRYVSKDSPYPDGMINDTLYRHLVRTKHILDNIFSTYEGLEVDKDFVYLTWLIHDLGELRDSVDTAAIDRGREDSNGETQHLKTIIQDSSRTEGEYLLKANCYRSYTCASKFLRREGKLPEVVDEEFLSGLLFRVVDIIDGNMYFNSCLNRWVRGGGTISPNHPGIKYPFPQRKVALKQLAKLPESNVKHLLIYLMTYQIEYIDSLWGEDKRGMPHVLAANVYKALNS